MRDGVSRLASDVFIGALAALRAPRLINSSLRTLIDPAPRSSRSPVDSDRAIRFALGALQVLARVPGSYWRNTCLYRSVAECAVRRARGWPARVVIGVGKERSDVIAHSWVEVTGLPSAAIPMQSLRPSHRRAE